MMLFPNAQLCTIVLILGCLVARCSCSNLKLTFNATTPVGTVHPRYVAYTLDWWPPRQGCPPNGWGPNANVLEVNLKSQKLRMLVSALGPSILRIGGTLDKMAEYEIKGLHCNNNNTNPCLNASRWDQLHEFAQATDSKIVFGLSYPEIMETEGKRNATPTTALLRYSQSQQYSRETTFYGVELGEELMFPLGTEAFAYYVKAYHDCSHLLKSIYPDQRQRPLLMGPCPGMGWPQLQEWFPAFLNATHGALDVAVYHSYNQIQENHLYLNFTNPYNWTIAPGGTGWQAVAMKEFVNGMRKPIPLWLGEMGPHNGGGGPGNISSTFASSFGYMDTLGSLARLNHQVLARQTLVGGKYELLQCTTTTPNCDFEPNPDYWIALLWKRLMGSVVLEAPKVDSEDDSSSWKNALRFHSHCGVDLNGSVTLAFSNTSPNLVFTVEAPVLLGETRVEYILSGKDGFHSDQLELNGSVLRVGESSELPLLQGRIVSNELNNPLLLHPVTLGLMVFPNANAAACKENDSVGMVETN